MFNTELKSILKGFTKTITSLENFANTAQNTVTNNQKQIDTLSDKNSSLQEDITIANTIADNLKKLLEV